MDFQTTQDWTNQLFNGNGAYTYSNLRHFAKDFTGNPPAPTTTPLLRRPSAIPIKSLRTTDINFYAQDTWKLSKKVTFSYGLRYEKSWLPQPTITNPDYPQTGIIPQQNKNFAPRVSLSYSIDDRTVLRAGYGIFYARIHGNLLDTLFLGNGKYQTSISVSPTAARCSSRPSQLMRVPGGTIALVGFADADKNFRAPYSQQGTLRCRTPVHARYRGDRQLHLEPRHRDLHPARSEPGTGPRRPITYTIQDATASTWAPTHAAVHFNQPRIRVTARSCRWKMADSPGTTRSRLQLEKRFSHGFTGQINYTWSHAIDDANMQGASWNISSTFNNATFNGNYALDKGTSTLDQRHRLSVNWMWRPAFTTSTSTFAKYFVNGWELSGITTLASAHPIGPTVNGPSTAANGVFPGVTLAYGTLNGSGGWNRVPFLPIDSINIDQIYNVDARITRSLPFGERVKANLSFEAFNAFNTIHNTSVQTAAYSVRPAAS